MSFKGHEGNKHPSGHGLCHGVSGKWIADRVKGAKSGDAKAFTERMSGKYDAHSKKAAGTGTGSSKKDSFHLKMAGKYDTAAMAGTMKSRKK